MSYVLCLLLNSDVTTEEKRVTNELHKISWYFIWSAQLGHITDQSCFNEVALLPGQRNNNKKPDSKVA